MFQWLAKRIMHTKKVFYRIPFPCKIRCLSVPNSLLFSMLWLLIYIMYTIFIQAHCLSRNFAIQTMYRAVVYWVFFPVFFIHFDILCIWFSLVWIFQFFLWFCFVFFRSSFSCVNSVFLSYRERCWNVMQRDKRFDAKEKWNPFWLFTLCKLLKHTLLCSIFIQWLRIFRSVFYLFVYSMTGFVCMCSFVIRCRLYYSILRIIANSIEASNGKTCELQKCFGTFELHCNIYNYFETNCYC